MSFPRISFLVLAALTLAIGGCKINTINSFPTKQASVRFIGLVPDAASLNVQKDNATVWAGIGFGAPTSYQQFDNKETMFSIFAPGVTSSIATASGSLAGEQVYSVVAFGTVANASTLFQSDSYLTANAGTAQYRITHAAFATNGLDFYLTSPGVPLAGLSPNFTLGYAGNTAFIRTNAGDYELRFVRSNSSIPAYDSGTVSLADQAALSFFIYAKDGTHAVDLLQVNMLSGETTVVPNTLVATKIVNAAYQTPAVDQKWDGNAGVTNVSYPSATQTYNTIPAGTHTITFEATAAPGSAIATANETFVSATDSTILISGANGSLAISVLPDNNLSPPSGIARVRMINASPDVPAFDVAIDGVVKASNVAYTHASAYFDLDSSNHKVQLLVPGTTTPVFSIDSQQFGSGQITSFYLVGPISALNKIITRDDI